jgi:uncharacterized protein YicC (UPF0701 family)
MIHTKDPTKGNGRVNALKKELKNTIDNGTLDTNAKLEANEAATRTMEINKIHMDSHGAIKNSNAEYFLDVLFVGALFHIP